MKLSTVFSVFSLTSWAVFASEEPILSDDTKAGDAPNIDFKVSYELAGHPKAAVYRLFNEEEVAIKYSFTNNEESDITVVGCGGAFKNPDTLQPLVNLTDAAIGPLAVQTEKEVSFIQKVGVDVAPQPYVLAPLLYISYNSVIYVITPTPSLVVVEDRPISIFDPQLLLVLVILAAGLGGAGYFLVTLVALPYINKHYLKKNVQKPVKTVKKAPVATASGSSKKYDENWLPAGHLKKQTRKK